MANMVFRLQTGKTDPASQTKPIDETITSTGGLMCLDDSAIIQTINSSYNNIFSDIDLKKEGQAILGEPYIDYAVVYLHNNQETKYDNFTQPEIFIEFDSQLAKYEVAILPKNEVAKVIPSSRVGPEDVVFKKTSPEKPIKMIGQDKFSAYLSKDEFCAIYIKRILEKGVVETLVASIDDSFNLCARGYE